MAIKLPKLKFKQTWNNLVDALTPEQKQRAEQVAKTPTPAPPPYKPPTMPDLTLNNVNKNIEKAKAKLPTYQAPVTPPRPQTPASAAVQRFFGTGNPEPQPQKGLVFDVSKPVDEVTIGGKTYKINQDQQKRAEAIAKMTEPEKPIVNKFSQNPIKSAVDGIAEGILRGTTRTAVGAMIPEGTQFQPRTGFERLLLGDQPVGQIADETANLEQGLKDKGFGKFALPLAFALTTVAPAFDVTGGGGSKVIRKEIQEKLIKELGQDIAQQVIKKGDEKLAVAILNKDAKALAEITKNASAQKAQPKVAGASVAAQLPPQAKARADQVVAQQNNRTPVKDLVTYEDAPDRARVEYYKREIAAGREPEPIKIKRADGEMGVEDGKHRLQAYKELGYKDVPKVEDTTKYNLEDLETRPDLFQKTRSLENLDKKGFEEFKVNEILKDFDEERLAQNPLSVGRFENGKPVVTSGHNRLEVLRRAKEQGKLTRPDSDFMKFTDYGDDYKKAIQESIDSNIKSKSVKDVNLLDLAIKGEIDDAALKNALAFDKKKVEFFDEISSTFKNNNLTDFWNNSVGSKLAQLKDLSFGAMSEKLNFVNRVAKKMSGAIGSLTPDQQIAVKNTIANKISEVMGDRAMTLAGVEKNIDRYLETIATGGYTNTEMVDLFGKIMTETDVATSSKAQTIKKLVAQNMKAGLVNKADKANLQWLDKAIADRNESIIGLIETYGGRGAKAETTQKIFKELVDLGKRYDVVKPRFEGAKREIDLLAQDLSSKYGGRIVDAPLKSKERTLEKALIDYGGDFDRVGDIARNTILLEDITKAKELLKELEGKGYKVKDLLDVENSFKGAIVKVKTSRGLPAEIQITTPEMIFANSQTAERAKSVLGEELFNEIKKGSGLDPILGHKLYEAVRPIQAKIDKGAKISPEVYKQLVEKKKELDAYFTSLNASFTRRLNSSSVRLSPRSIAEPSSVPSTSKSPVSGFKRKQLAPPSGSSSTLSKSPSKSKKTNLFDIEKSPSDGSLTPPTPPVKSVKPPLPKLPKERGFIETVKETPKTAPEVKARVRGLYQPKTNKDVLERARRLITRDPDEALRIAKSPEPATAESNAVGQLLIDDFQKSGNYQQAIEIVETLAEKATKQGQAIQALSLYGRLDEQGVLRYAQRVIDKANAERPKLKLKLSPEKADDLVTQARKIKKMPEGEDKLVETAVLLKKIQDAVPPTLLKKISTFQTMAQLLNPKTFIRNVVGNAGFAAAENVSDVVGTAIDKATSVFTGQRSKVLPNLKVQGQGFTEGIRKGIRDAMQGIDTSGMIGTQFDLPKTQVFKGKVLGSAEKLLNVELRATDRGFYNAAYKNSLDNQMRAAKVDVPTEAMKEVAHFDGLHRTFQDDNLATKAFGWIKKGLNVGKEFGLGDIVLKYPKTPANLLVRGLEYSPAGFIKTVIELARPLAGGKFNQKAFVEATSRALTGTTGGVATGALLHRLGIITGGRNEDNDVATLQDQTGIGQYKLNASALLRFVMSGFDPEAAKLQKGDNLWSYDWFQPQAISLSIGANIDESGMDPKSNITQVLDGVASGIDTLAEQPLVKGLVQPLKFNKVSGVVKEWMKGVPASFTPTLFSQLRQMVDPYQRNTSDPDFFKEMYARVANKLPFLSKTLQPKIGVFGQKQKQYQGHNNIFNVMLNPSFNTEYLETPEAKMVFDIYKNTGERQQFPRVVTETQTVNGKSVKLTPKQVTQLQNFVGDITRTQFNRLATNNDFQRLGDEEKAKELANLLTDIGTAGKIIYLGHTPSRVSGRAKQIINDYNQKTK